jgi:hypothetical protein
MPLVSMDRLHFILLLSQHVVYRRHPAVTQPTITCMETQGSTLLLRGPRLFTGTVDSGVFFWFGSMDIPECQLVAETSHRLTTFVLLIEAPV